MLEGIDYTRMPLDSDYFTETWTRMGRCYTFNSAEYQQSNSPFKASEAGNDNGLHLLINIQQSQYFAGTKSAGLKVSIGK